MSTATAIPQYTKADFSSGVQVRWCPGCGDYSILAAVQSVLPKVGKRKEDVVFISGIGCSSRFPYYMGTYGFHTIHGRAPAVATGVKSVNPDLQVWLITGDGDGLSIGGNHMLHALRRNVDLKILLFNNEIYGLTKGQYSPTSRVGTKASSTPYGSVDEPVNPIAFALGAGATFVARTSDNDPAHLQKTLEAAAAHKGSAFIEIMQNCIIFNNKIHEPYYGRSVREETLVYLENGKPLVYGKDGSKGLFAEGFRIGTAVVDEGNRDKILVHDSSDAGGSLAFALAHLQHPEQPVPVGIFRNVERPEFVSGMVEQIAKVQAAEGTGDLEKLFRSGTVWKVS